MNGRRCGPRDWEGDERIMEVKEEGSIIMKDRCEIFL